RQLCMVGCAFRKLRFETHRRSPLQFLVYRGTGKTEDEEDVAGSQRDAGEMVLRAAAKCEEVALRPPTRRCGLRKQATVEDAGSSPEIAPKRSEVRAAVHRQRGSCECLLPGFSWGVAPGRAGRLCPPLSAPANRGVN